MTLLGCGGETADLRDTGATPDAALAPEGLCDTPPGLGTPNTAAEVIALMNALPDPVTVPCFVQALDRPLHIVATKGRLSAQPAIDAQNPRIFIFSGNLILSVVPAGFGRDLLELAEYYSATESLKGEVRTPAAHPIDLESMYGHLRYSSAVTVCGFCHRNERLATDVGHPNAMISEAFRPRFEELIPLDDLRAEHAACDPDEAPERCAIFSAVFDHGPVKHRDFDADLATFLKP